MEKERKINWLGLFVKIIIVFIFVLIIIWLVSKITMKTRLSDTFKNNINNMESVATNYFKSIELPLEKGKSKQITLGEMVDKGLIVSVKDKEDSSCDTSKSFSKITRKKSNYKMETTLKCGNEKSTITKEFSFKDCKNCNKTSENNTKKESDSKSNSKTNNTVNNSAKTDNNDNSTNTNNNSTTETAQNTTVDTGTTYYEHVKETTVYTKWMKGNVTGNNIENRYEYYGIARNTYYTLGVIKETDFISGNTIGYTLKLNKVPNKNYYFSAIEEKSYFISSEESRYVNEKDVSMNKGNYSIPKSITNYSLTSNNFTYKLSPYYRKGIFYIDVEITINNTSGVSSYKNNGKGIYFVPLKLNIKFASDNITSTIPNGDYETISYYRYVETKRDVIWSPDSYIEGYTKTGKSEIRK